MLAAPMARLQQKSRRQSPQVQPEQPAFPARRFYAYIVISSVHRAFWPPSPPGSAPGQLDTSVGVPGPHDFTSADLAFVSRKPNVHRIPAPRVVTIARNAPLNEAGWW